MNLGQLVQLAKFFEVVTKEELNTDELENVLSEFLGVRKEKVRLMSLATMNEVKEKMLTLFGKCANEYKEVLESKDFIYSFKAKAKEPFEVSTYLQRMMNKDVTFLIDENPANEPAAIWVKILDGAKRKLAKAEKIYQEWQYIPQIVSCLSWRRNESRFTTGLDGTPMVDMARIQKFEKVFEQMNAKEGIQVFAFFLTMNADYFKSQAMR